MRLSLHDQTGHRLPCRVAGHQRALRAIGRVFLGPIQRSGSYGQTRSREYLDLETSRLTGVVVPLLVPSIRDEPEQAHFGIERVARHEARELHRPRVLERERRGRHELERLIVPLKPDRRVDPAER